MKIAVYPSSKSKYNQYVDLITNALKINGHEVLDFSLKKLLTRRYIHVEYFHFNWFENCYTLKEFVKKILILFVLVINRKKIVFVMHNKQVHANKQSFIAFYYSKILMKLLFRISYKIIIHSKHSVDYINNSFREKVIYVPHPNYVDVYGNIVETNDKKPQTLNLLFMGLIREYKNIELLIDVVSKFKEDQISLMLAGMVISKDYEIFLINKLQNVKNIQPVFKFIENEEIPLFLSKCDLVILPYDVKSSLNSGSVLLAFSYKKTIISPEICTLEDMDNKCFFSYNYKNEKEHATQLNSIIHQLIQLKKANPTVFDEWGEAMYNEVLEKNSNKVVCRQLDQVYSE